MIEVAQRVEHGLRGELQGPQADRLVALVVRVLDVMGEGRVDLLRSRVEEADVLPRQMHRDAGSRTHAVHDPLKDSNGRSTRHLTGTSVRLIRQRHPPSTGHTSR